MSPGIVAARLLCRCFVTDRKVACLVCTNPTTSATIVRHVRDYSEKRSFDDKPASKVASPGRSSRSEPATQKFADRAFSPIDGPRGINERGEGKSAGDGDRRSILISLRFVSALRVTIVSMMYSFPIASIIFFASLASSSTFSALPVASRISFRGGERLRREAERMRINSYQRNRAVRSVKGEEDASR